MRKPRVLRDAFRVVRRQRCIGTQPKMPMPHTLTSHTAPHTHLLLARTGLGNFVSPDHLPFCNVLLIKSTLAWGLHDAAQEEGSGRWLAQGAFVSSTATLFFAITRIDLAKRGRQ